METQKTDKEIKHQVLGLDNKTDKCVANVIKTKKEREIVSFSTKEKNMTTNTKNDM